MFLTPRWSIEFEDAEMRASRTNGLKDVNVGILSGRLVGGLLEMGNLSVLIGAGAGISTETNFMHTYGVDALAGLRLKMSDRFALRLDGVWDWLANEDWKQYQSVRLGLSVYRHPSVETRTVTVPGPAPRPDTVVVTREAAAAPLPTGSATEICLATGEAVTVLVTAQGDTLVGPSRTSVRVLRQGGVAFAGDYAQGRTWFEQDQPMTFEQMSYQKSGAPVRLNCPDITRVGEYMGVPLFARRDAMRPYTQLYVPVAPGIWQMYENLRQTRG